MKGLRQSAIAVGLSLALTGTQSNIARAQDTQPPPESGMTMPRPGSADPVANEGVVEDNAVDALRQMSAFLKTANTLQINGVGSLDVVTNDGQRIQLDGTTTYKVRKPNGFVVDYNSDIKSRRFIYDGKTFTVYSPKLGYYATAPAPATNKEVLDTIYDKFGISLPLEDLFRWNDGAEDRIKSLRSAYKVGTATIDGAETDHYAFREDDVDWEVWIQQGDQPFPRKLVIVDRTDPARPTFISRLSWMLNPAFTDADFTFVPDANAKKIQLATYKGE